MHSAVGSQPSAAQQAVAASAARHRHLHRRASRRHLAAHGFLMRPQLNSGTLGGRMVDFHRRLACAAELDELFDLHRDAFKAHVEELWGSWDDDWQRQNFRRECAESSCEAVVNDNALLGYVQHVWETGRVRIWNIALWPQFRAHGIGSRIVRDFQQLALSRDAGVVLRVFPNNQAAFQFYGRLGFREVARTSTGVELSWQTQ